MSGRDDHQDDMALHLRPPSEVDSALDALVAGGPVPSGFEGASAVLDDLRLVGAAAAPAPTAALAEFLARPTRSAGDVVLDLDAGRRRRAARAGAAALTVAVMTLGSVGVAAAQGKLPDRAQDAVASAVSALTPFSVPRAQRDPVTPEPAEPSAGPTPTSGAVQGTPPRPAQQTIPAPDSSDAADGDSSTQSGGGDSPQSSSSRQSDDSGSRDTTAPPADQPEGTSPDGGTEPAHAGTSPSGGDAGSSSSPAELSRDASDPGLTGGAAAPARDGADIPTVSASPES